MLYRCHPFKVGPQSALFLSIIATSFFQKCVSCEKGHMSTFGDNKEWCE